MGVALIFISSYQLFLSRLTQHEGLSLGTLERTEAVVKIKNTLALDWRDAYSGFDVSEQQLIYTDKDSSAEVKFLQGHKITISENSLIRIASVGQYGGVNVQKGFIRAKIQGNKPLVIEVNGSELKLTGENADVQISLEGNKGQIGVLSGEVSVENEGQVERIDKSSALNVNEGRFEKHKISFSLLEPLLSQTIYTLNASEKVTFKWDPAASSEMKISQYPSFKNSKLFHGEGSALVELTPGTYYWKVENEKGSSLIGRFGLVRELPPEILRPIHGAQIKLPVQVNTDPQIFLQWKGVVGQDYIVEWVDSSSHSQKLKAHGLIIPVAASGPLQWRVKLDSAERSQAQWSEWQKLEITLVDLPAIPTDLLPEELELQSYSNEEFDVELSWKSLSKTELEIIGPRNERTIQELPGSSYLFKAKNPGTYRWRVRGKDEFLRLSEWSAWKTFTLEDLSHEVSSEGFQRIQLKKPDQSVTFSWKAAAGSKTIFELSESKEFTDVVVKKEVSAAEVKVAIPKTGNFYWRSRQYLPDGTFNVSEPKKVIIEPAPAPLKPQKLPDLEVPIEWRETSLPKTRWWNFLISEAIADDFKGVAKIQLPINEDAKKYVVKIFRDAEGTELLIEKTVEEPAIEWENAKAGHYYWQYALIDFWGRQSPFSDLSSLSVTGSEPIMPEKPKLLAPIRAAEVEEKGFKIKWSPSDRNKNYRLDISRTEDFEKPLIQETTSENEITLKKSGLQPGLYYWRVSASSSSQKEVLSNTGRFTIVPPLEKITIVDRPEAWVKKYGKRISFVWAPSMDSYEFNDEGSKGQIDGNSLNAIEARGLYFSNQFIFAADLLRQSGEVFEGEKYLFQRLQFGATWKKQQGNHLWGPGVSVGFVSGFSYEINNDVVSSSAVSGLIYGPHLQGFYALSPVWELQGKLSYMLGAIPHIELMTEASRQMKNFYLVMGVGYSMRDYTESDGSQTSMKLNLGLGKEF